MQIEIGATHQLEMKQRGLGKLGDLNTQDKCHKPHITDCLVILLGGLGEEGVWLGGWVDTPPPGGVGTLSLEGGVPLFSAQVGLPKGWVGANPQVFF